MKGETFLAAPISDELDVFALAHLKRGAFQEIGLHIVGLGGNWLSTL